MRVDEKVPTFHSDEDLSPAGIEAYDAAFERCRQGMGLPPIEDPGPLNLPQLYVDTVAAKTCLESLGYTMSEPPRMEVWIESYDRGPWLPHGEPRGLPEDEWNRVIEACPQPENRPVADG